MSIDASILLGLIQGVTEFLPVSSSGHLIISRTLFGFSGEFGLAVDAVLHFATALAVLAYFRVDFFELAFAAVGWAKGIRPDERQRILLLSLVIGTIPAAFAGVYLETIIGTLFRNPALVAYALIIGSLVFLAAEWFARQREALSVWKGLGIGIFQTLALIPGMSRSGMAISGGLLFGLPREAATRFAFMLGLPLLLGAGFKKLLDLGTAGAFTADFAVALAAGSITAFVFGLLAIHVLIKYLRTHTLQVFVWYRLALAAGILILL